MQTREFGLLRSVCLFALLVCTTLGPARSASAGEPNGAEDFTLVVRHAFPLSAWTWSAGVEQTKAWMMLRYSGGIVAPMPWWLTGGNLLLPGYHSNTAETDPLWAPTCYLLVPVDENGPRGNSDLLCGSITTGGGTAPAYLQISLNQSFTARLVWQAVTGVPEATGYVVISNAGDVVALPMSTTTLSLPITGPTCYTVYLTSAGSVLGSTDFACAVPGVYRAAGSVAAGAATRAADQVHRMTAWR